MHAVPTTTHTLHACYTPHPCLYSLALVASDKGLEHRGAIWTKQKDSGWQEQQELLQEDGEENMGWDGDEGESEKVYIIIVGVVSGIKDRLKRGKC